jgi:hypothetical protein
VRDIAATCWLPDGLRLCIEITTDEAADRSPASYPFETF